MDILILTILLKKGMRDGLTLHGRTKCIVPGISFKPKFNLK